jgi:hypothetical protein
MRKVGESLNFKEIFVGDFVKASFKTDMLSKFPMEVKQT